MREVTEKFKVYKFSDAPKEIQERIREEISYSWDIYCHSMEERIHTLKKFSEAIHGTLDYSLSCVPDRGEFIKITHDTDYYLKQVIKDNESCPFTGTCYDDDILYDLRAGLSLTDTLNKFINSMHEEYEFMLTDEYLLDFCDANKYEFLEDGKLYS